MEAVNNNEDEKPTTQSKLIVVLGVDDVSKAFLQEALMHIISQAGYSVNVKPFGENEETDFHIVSAGKFEAEIEAKAALVFASYKNPATLFSEDGSRIKKQKENAFGSKKTIIDDFTRIQANLYQLIKWMRSAKLAYCMDYDSPMNAKGLHNYNNLRNMILPLVYAFQQQPPPEGKFRFDKINPQKLIELLVPELKDKSAEASDKFDKRVDELKQEGAEVQTKNAEEAVKKDE